MYEYLGSHLWLFWALAGLLFLIIEVSLGSFFLLCLAIGAFFSMFISLLEVPFWLQILLFSACSVLSIFFVRPFALRYLHRHTDERRSNVDALIGRTGIVIEPIADHGNGYVKVDGDEWRAVSFDGTAVENGAAVRIIKMDSLVATVQKI